MLYVSNIINKDVIEITDTNTATSSKESINTLYSKYANKVVEGLTFSPKRKKPIIMATTPTLLVLDRIPLGQVVLLRRNQNMGFEHCIKVKQSKNAFVFYNGGGNAGLFVLTRNLFIEHKNNIAVDIGHVDMCVADLLKKDYKQFLRRKER